MALQPGLGTPPAVPSDAVPNVAGSASAGTSTLFSRGDHIHPAQSIPAVPTASNAIPLVDATNGAAGSGTAYSRDDHVHPIFVLPVGTPNQRTLAFGTAYQATTPTKASQITVMIDAAYSITLAGTQADTVELRIGPNATTVANGTGGTPIATFRASLTGIALTIGMGLGQRNPLQALLPAGWYFAVRRVSGTTATINDAYDQSIN